MAGTVHYCGRRSFDAGPSPQAPRPPEQAGDAGETVSIVAMNWAWRQSLAPTTKLVLMALADAADDHGICWPSVATLATKCSISTRTVRRTLQTLIILELLVAEPRYRPDGSCSSNRYRLQLRGGDKLSPAPDRDVTTPGRVRQGPPDTAVHPGTTRRTQKESPPPLPMESPSVICKSVEGGSEWIDLEYPATLSAAERDGAAKRLAGLPAPLAQQLLDELAGRMVANAIRTTPLAYLRGLVKRAQVGAFTPEVALEFADRRRRRCEVAASLEHAKAAVRRHLATEPKIAGNPLVDRLLAIQKRQQNRHRTAEPSDAKPSPIPYRVDRK